jgi:hypothetical protein
MKCVLHLMVFEEWMSKNDILCQTRKENLHTRNTSHGTRNARSFRKHSYIFPLLKMSRMAVHEAPGGGLEAEYTN